MPLSSQIERPPLKVTKNSVPLSLFPIETSLSVLPPAVVVVIVLPPRSGVQSPLSGTPRPDPRTRRRRGPRDRASFPSGIFLFLSRRRRWNFSSPARPRRPVFALPCEPCLKSPASRRDCTD